MITTNRSYVCRLVLSLLLVRGCEAAFSPHADAQPSFVQSRRTSFTFPAFSPRYELEQVRFSGVLRSFVEENEPDTGAECALRLLGNCRRVVGSDAKAFDDDATAYLTLTVSFKQPLTLSIASGTKASRSFRFNRIQIRYSSSRHPLPTIHTALLAQDESPDYREWSDWSQGRDAALRAYIKRVCFGPSKPVRSASADDLPANLTSAQTNALQRLRSIGGSVRVTREGLSLSYAFDTHDPRTLSWLEPFDSVHELRLSRELTDQALARIPAMDEVTILRLEDEKQRIGDGLTNLARIKSIDRLHLTGFRLTDRHLATIGKCETITNLTLFRCDLAAARPRLSGIKSLAHLGIVFTTLAPPAFKEMMESSGARSVMLLGTPITKDMVNGLDTSPVARFGALQSGLTGALFARLVDKLPRLEEVAIHGARQLDDAAFRALLAKRALISLLVSGNDINDSHVPQISQLDLTQLSLKDTSITPSGLDALAAIPNLGQLSLSGERVTADQIAAIAGLKQLLEVNLQGKDLDVAKLEPLFQTGRLKKLQVTGSSFTRDEVYGLLRLTTTSDDYRVFTNSTGGFSVRFGVQ